MRWEGGGEGGGREKKKRKRNQDPRTESKGGLFDRRAQQQAKRDSDGRHTLEETVLHARAAKASQVNVGCLTVMITGQTRPELAGQARAKRGHQGRPRAKNGQGSRSGWSVGRSVRRALAKTQSIHLLLTTACTQQTPFFHNRPCVGQKPAHSVGRLSQHLSLLQSWLPEMTPTREPPCATTRLT